MLYPKRQEETLSGALFEHPTAEYRGAPFWAWNCKLEREELERQIDVLHEMGFGGFHMHVRSGLCDEYLGEKFMQLVADCVQKAKDNEMLAWLYDEDRWPSGMAGGLVTKEKKYRRRYLIFTKRPYTAAELAGKTQGGGEMDMHAGRRGGQDITPLAAYAVEQNEAGEMCAYHRLADGEQTDATVYYLYAETQRPGGRYNGQTYVDTLSKEAMQRFVEITHEAYRRKVGTEFGKTVPAIFTDEPQFSFKQNLRFATGDQDASMPWSNDFDESFSAAYGYSVLDKMPEVFLELPKGALSQVRYHFHEHVAERFAEAFADTIGAWCDQNGILLTGHMMAEPKLSGQSQAVGDAMRSYRSFSLPGIDMLSDRREYTTAKQAQSAVHQQGAPGVMSELYGVTTWDFDFRGHKLYGDWQAALGVTVRVPHLAWVSMEGEAKRDYPASISYQSPWYKEYKYVEDHFARVNTALVRGRPVVRVGVIHPIETYWMHYGPSDQTSAIRKTLDKRFADLAEWLLFGSIDFDFICEGNLPRYCAEGGAPLQVGEMQYDVIVVPGCETLRATTLERLEAFRRAGGRLIFMDAAPTHIDALPDARGAALAADCEVIPYDENALLRALETVREVELRNMRSGTLTDDLLYNLRVDGDGKWLFVARGKQPKNYDLAETEKVQIKVRGHYTPTLYNTLDGTTAPMAAQLQGDFTAIPVTLYQHDSLLIRLEAGEGAVLQPAAVPVQKALPVPATVPFTLHEPNALVLDMAAWSLDGGAEQPREEMLRVDDAVRSALGYRSWGGKSPQPWCLSPEPPTHRVRLVYEFESEIEVKAPLLGIECPEDMSITLNGEAPIGGVNGYYVDRSIKTLPLPPVRAGRNVLTIEKPYGARSALENVFILGDFGVRVVGSTACITALPRTLGFSDITSQGLPFYSGALSYHIDVQTAGGDLQVCVPRYRASVLRIGAEGESAPVAFSPYTARLSLPAGAHRVDITAYIPRTNGFAPLHNCDETCDYQNPAAWRTTGDKWSYEYCLSREGLLAAPRLAEIKSE